MQLNIFFIQQCLNVHLLPKNTVLKRLITSVQIFIGRKLTLIKCDSHHTLNGPTDLLYLLSRRQLKFFITETAVLLTTSKAVTLKYALHLLFGCHYIW